MTEATVTLDLRYAGSCQHPEAMVVARAPWRPATFPAMFAVIRHSRRGVTLFDTGYAPRFNDATQPFPARIYRWLTPMTLADGDSAAAQVAAMGIDPATVERVVLSHFHADHIAGARDFPHARYIATQEAFEAVRRASAFGKLRRGFLPDLLPDDFLHRADLLVPTDFRGESLPGFGPSHDLLGDGSVQLVPLPGHARGQVGALVRGSLGERTFLVADAAWTTAAFREYRPSHPIAGLIMEHAGDAARTLRAIHDLSLRDPALDIVPSHCAARAHLAQR